MRAEFDVRSLTTAQRYERILSAFVTLKEGSRLRIIVDHEPMALRVRLAEAHAGNYVWSQRNLDEGYWEATICRVAPLDDTAEAGERVLHCSSAFTDLSNETRAKLAAAALSHSFEAGATIADQGVAWPHIGLVVSGSVSATVDTENGRTYVLYTAYPSDTFAEVQALDAGVTLARYAAGHETSVLLLPRDLTLELAERDGRFARTLASICAQRARLTHEMLYARVTKPTIARLAAVMLPYATQADGLAKTLQPLPSMSQSDLASAAGTVKDVVGRDLAELRAAGAIDVRGGRVTRIDAARLRPFL